MEKEEEFALKCKDGVVRIAFADLEYIEVINKTVFFHLAGGAVHEATAALAGFENEFLARPEFVKTHRSYLVNLGCVQAVGEQCAVTKSGNNVPVSRQRRNQVQDAYMQFLNQEAADASSGAQENSFAEKKVRPEGPWQILLVDDDLDECTYWAEILQKHGCMTHLAENGRKAVELAGKEYFDCVLLDVMISGENGFSICEKLHRLTGAPVIFLSCMTEADMQLKGFMSGGIDYITKDTPAELFWAKVRTGIKLAASECIQMRFGPLLLNLTERRVWMNGKELPFLSAEFDILWRLSEYPGRIFTPEEISDMVWGDASLEGGQMA